MVYWKDTLRWTAFWVLLTLRKNHFRQPNSFHGYSFPYGLYLQFYKQFVSYLPMEDFIHLQKSLRDVMLVAKVNLPCQDK